MKKPNKERRRKGEENDQKLKNFKRDTRFDYSIDLFLQEEQDGRTRTRRIRRTGRKKKKEILVGRKGEKERT